MIHIVDKIANLIIFIFLLHFCWRIDLRKGVFCKMVVLIGTLVAGGLCVWIQRESFMVYAIWSIVSMIIIFAGNPIHTIICTIFLWIFTGMIDTYASIIVQIICKKANCDRGNLEWWMELSYILSLAFYLLVYYEILKKNNLYLDEIRKLYKLALLAVTFIFEFVIVYIFEAFYESGDDYNLYLHIRFIFCLIGVFFTVLMTLELAVKNTILQKQKSILTKSLDIIKNQYDFQRKKSNALKKFRHDLRNHMSMINELLVLGDYGKAKSYMKELWLLTEGMTDWVKTGDDYLDAICNHYMYMCEKKGIRFEVSGRLIYPLEMRLVDTTAIFGNALENAVEAAEQMENAFVKLDIKEHKSETFFTVINNCKLLIHDRRGGICTTKDDKTNHGFGISNIEDIIEKYKGESYISQMILEDANCFKLEFSIPRGNC